MSGLLSVILLAMLRNMIMPDFYLKVSKGKITIVNFKNQTLKKE
jgi:hypothetical protein